MGELGERPPYPSDLLRHHGFVLGYVLGLFYDFTQDQINYLTSLGTSS